MTSRRTSGVLAAALAVLSALVLCFTPVVAVFGILWVGYEWGTWHTFVLPHLVLSLILLTFYVCGVVARRVNRHVRAVAGWVQPFLALTDVWAMSQWPGGDDGGGMAWLLIVGPVTAVVLVIGARVAAGRRDGEARVAAGARTAFCAGTGVGFGIWAAIPWVDILLSL